MGTLLLVREMLTRSLGTGLEGVWIVTGKLRGLARGGGRWASSATTAARSTLSQRVQAGSALRQAPTRADELSAAERADLLAQFNAGMALRPKPGPDRDAQREALLEKFGTRPRPTPLG